MIANSSTSIEELQEQLETLIALKPKKHPIVWASDTDTGW